MCSLLDGIEKYGLDSLKTLSIYDKPEVVSQQNKQVVGGNSGGVVEFSEADVLFDKTYTCPVCDSEIKVKTLKTGKVKLSKLDIDLRPIYANMDPLKYDVILCPHCGYAALSRYFKQVMSSQVKLIKSNISDNLKGLPKFGDTYTYDEALLRIRLALLNAIVKKSKSSERAYICLKTAWLLRGKAENLPKDKPDREKQLEVLGKEELDFIKKAYLGFTDAFSKESFPMCGMDENTVTLLVAELARRVGEHDAASRWVSKLLVSRDANDRLKDRAREIKDMLKN